MTCIDNAGGHYYTGSVTADPWTSIAYTSDSSGATSGSLSVTTGGSSAEVAGRAMIIHGFDGGRIGCAILGAATQLTLTASSFVPYYTYAGALSVSGTVGPMTTSGTTQTFYYSLSGVDPSCSSGAGTKANSCGIQCAAASRCLSLFPSLSPCRLLCRLHPFCPRHMPAAALRLTYVSRLTCLWCDPRLRSIHVGKTCVANAGGHYFTGSVTDDPWTSITYTASADGKSSGTHSVDTGALSSDVHGRAMIIHAFDGSRIACAILSDGVSSTLQAGTFVKYYNYNGALAVSGTVGPMTTSSDTTQTFHYSLSGVDPSCSSGAGTNANSCGIQCAAASRSLGSSV